MADGSSSLGKSEQAAHC